MTSASRWAQLAGLISYPRRHPAARLADCIQGSRRCGETDVAAALERFAAAIDGRPLPALQERYAETFDFNPACTLDLGWHLFQDSHERGAFMAALAEDLARAGVTETMELPDHLTNVLALLGHEESGRAPALARSIEPALDRIFRALDTAGNPYASVLEAIQSALAGIPARCEGGAALPAR